MKISPLTSVYSYRRSMQNTSFRNQRVSFRGPVEREENLQLLKELGYKYRDEVDLISPDGRNIKGNAYLKDELDTVRYGEISFVVTDKDNFELGELASSRQPENACVLKSSIRNYTVDTYLDGKFMNPIMPFRNASGGHYKGVGRALYNQLEKYVSERYPDIKKLFINAINSDSYDFHCKVGFDGEVGDYDCYSMTNYLEKKLK